MSQNKLERRLPMNAHASCYGRLFPPVDKLTPNRAVAGAVFGYELEQHGIVRGKRLVTTNLEAWDGCAKCPEFESCYRLSAGKMVMDLALRD
jgi:hypothetical protein